MYIIYIHLNDVSERAYQNTQHEIYSASWFVKNTVKDTSLNGRLVSYLSCRHEIQINWNLIQVSGHLKAFFPESTTGYIGYNHTFF